VVILALDSTAAEGSAALWRPDGEIVVVRLPAPGGYGRQLPGALLDLLGSHGLSLAQVELFAVASGPGSLTGLRVGIATIQGLAFATGRPVVAVSALDALAETLRAAVPPPPSGCLLGAWKNAQRREVFAALYAQEAAGPEPLRLLGAPEVGHPEAIAARWVDEVPGEGQLWASGDADEAARGALVRALGSRLVWRDPPPLAAAVARLARRRAPREAGRPHAVHPLYVRRPDAEVARERREQAVTNHRFPVRP
jgi:tRNA threonylcarbamoyladenosine biosynthesis protein TsaB